jgi:hypothetical protein
MVMECEDKERFYMQIINKLTKLDGPKVTPSMVGPQAAIQVHVVFGLNKKPRNFEGDWPGDAVLNTSFPDLIKNDYTYSELPISTIRNIFGNDMEYHQLCDLQCPILLIYENTSNNLQELNWNIPLVIPFQLQNTTLSDCDVCILYKNTEYKLAELKKFYQPIFTTNRNLLNINFGNCCSSHI